MKAVFSNDKRSRFIQKTDDELLFEILVRVEQVGSFCPEKLMYKKNNRLFTEVYRRFETWDAIVEQCVKFANKFELIGAPLKTPKEVILEILRLESEGQSFGEADVLYGRPELHAAAVLFYGSWNQALVIVGLMNADEYPEGEVRNG